MLLCSEKLSCEFCGLTGRLLYDNLRDRQLDTPGRWTVLTCDECGLAWHSPQPSPDELYKLYPSYYTHRPAALATFKSTGAAKLIKHILAKIFYWRAPQFLSDNFHLQQLRPGRLLEIGCGNGEFLLAATRDGWIAQGIDFDSSAVAAAKRAGAEAEVGELLDMKFPSYHFDAIVMNNVIEHVWNPIPVVQDCFRILRPGGRLVLITPNKDSLGHHLFKRNWRGLETPRHLFLYSTDSLLALARIAGFHKATSFSSAGGNSGAQMLEWSLKWAREEGSHKRWHLPNLLLRHAQTVGSMLGFAWGEWVVLVADR